MTTSSILIKIPSCPFSLDALRPNRPLAQLATCLKADDHTTTILDYGTLDMFERLYPTHLQNQSDSLIDDISHEIESTSFNELLQQWEKIGHPDTIKAHQQQIWQECAIEIAEIKDLDFIALQIDSYDVLSIATMMIPIIKNIQPSLRIMGLGDLFVQNTHALAEFAEHFDCIIWGTQPSILLSVINHLDQSTLWKQLPYLAFYEEGHFCLTQQDSSTPETPLPDYSAGTYPALYDSGKLLFFEVEDCPKHCFPSTECTIEEIQLLQEIFNAQAFQLSGSDTQSLHAEHLAHALIDRHINIRYTRECQIQSTPNSTVSLLPASGCYGVEFQIDTGSQRLLDNYYRHPFTVTQVEKTVRACKFSNLYTVMNLAFPSIEDDYHTLSETIRLTDRCKPHSAPVRIPAQIHKPLSDLKQRFEIEPNYRNDDELQADQGELINALNENGISTHITPPMALIANLAGYRGLEDDFIHQLMHQLLTGDSLSLKTLVKQLNRSICKTPNTVTFTPFTPLQHVVGN